LFDSSGQENFEHIRTQIYPDVDLVFLAFDVSQRISYDNCLTTWLTEKKNYLQKAKIGLLATKVDLRDGTGNFITEREGLKMQKKLNASFYVETSSLNGTGVEDAFKKAVEAIEEEEEPSCCLFTYLL